MGVVIGFYVNCMFGELNGWRVVLSVVGVYDGGFYNSNLLLVEMECVMMCVVDEVIVVVDSIKFGYKSLVYLCEFDVV